MTLAYKTAFASRIDLKKYAEDALALFALQLRFQIDDIDTVATRVLTNKFGGTVVRYWRKAKFLSPLSISG